MSGYTDQAMRSAAPSGLQFDESAAPAARDQVDARLGLTPPHNSPRHPGRARP